MANSLRRTGTVPDLRRLSRYMNRHNYLKSLVALFTLLVLSVYPASAQMFGETKTKADILLAQTRATPGSEVRGVIRFRTEDHWHTYWKYAGEVGLPTEVAWTLPVGWEATPFQWPTPEFLDTAGLVSYAYNEEALFPFTLKVPKDAATGEKASLKAELTWLECKDTCVPGQASIELTLEVGDTSAGAPAEVQAILARAQEKIPIAKSDIKIERDGSKLRILIPEEMTGTEFRFFPDSEAQIVELAPQTLEGADAERALVVQSAEGVTALSGVLSDGVKSYEFRADIGARAAAAPPAGVAAIAFTALAAFAGGLILNLMPCVFPVLSLKVLGIVEQSKGEGRPAWHHGLVFTAGVLVSFWVMSGILLGVRAAGDGVGWGYHLQNPLMVAGLAFLFLLISLNLFGVFEVGENLTSLSGVAEKKEGFAHSFWSGVLTTLAATPCTAPFMGGAVGFALSQSNIVALAIFSALALGVAAPYFTLTCFPKLLRKLPKPGPWMITFKQVLAFPMLVAVVWLTWVFGGQMGTDRMALLMLALVGASLACWLYGRWGTSFEAGVKARGVAAAALSLALALYTGYAASLPPLGEELWKEYSPELVSSLKAEGKPYFLDFTADWCTSCKANELVALSRPEVLKKFQDLDVTLVKADWTRQDDTITKALAEYGRAGVPLYVLYKGGEQEPVLLPEVLLPGTVLDALDGVGKG